MKRNEILRSKAEDLRRKGYTLNDIAGRLCVPKSTAYGWIREVPVERPNAFIERTRRNNKAAARKAAQALRRKYALIHDEHRRLAEKEWNESLRNNERFKLFLMLYLTEGKRRCRGTVGFCNTNPDLILFGADCLQWLNADRHKITYSLLLRDNMDESRIVDFWRRLLETDRITVYTRGGGGRLQGRNRCASRGIMTVLVNDSYLKTRIETWIELFVTEQLLRGLTADTR